mmetsp:Transcript_44885/g.100911  ORF Transcript_44885/g.100911 Transcript_44885/m.100911 type:complete len:468 (+) Transcript_44885:139-1542(+)
MGILTEASPIWTESKHSKQAKLQGFRSVKVTCFQLVYSSINTGMGLFVLPTEAERLNDHSGGLWVGVYLAVCGATQLICPIAGKLSDRHSSRWGRRRPFIFWGTCCTILSFGAMWAASAHKWRILYLVALFHAQLALNVVFSAQSALPADLQGGEEQSATDGTKGIVSGIIALHSFIGSLKAMGVLVATRNMPVQVEYPVYMISLVVACIVVCQSARERPTNRLPGAPRQASFTIQDIVGSYRIDMREDTNFFWVCVGRLFYYVSTSVVVFMYYYVRDMLQVSGEAERRSCLGMIVVFAQLVGAIFTVPISHLSNRVGRKSVIYAACIIMTSTFLLYAAAPRLGPERAWPLVLAATLCYGLGSGAYLSVDYALALDCMPAKKTTAEAFGVWGIAGFMGATIGPMLGGSILDHCLKRGVISSFGGVHSPKDSYPYVGYVAVMLILGVCMNAMVVLVTTQIQTDKKLLS